VDRVKLVSVGFDSYIAIMKTFPPTVQNELRMVGVYLYGELLKNETSIVDLAGPTLPVLKSLLGVPREFNDPSDGYAKLVHGILSACLVNVDHMSGRQGLASTRKIQSNLLASVLVLTIVPVAVKVSQAAIDHCCFLICQKLAVDEVSLTAAHCAKTLVTAAASGNQMLRQCPRLLMPGLIEFVAQSPGMVEGGTLPDTRLAALNEVWKAFSLFFASVPEDSRVRLLCVLLPTATLVLDPNSSPQSTLHAQGITHLLSYATSAPVAFKEATGTLPSTTRDILEMSIRQAVEGMGGAKQTQAAKPQISLRSF